MASQQPRLVAEPHGLFVLALPEGVVPVDLIHIVDRGAVAEAVVEDAAGRRIAVPVEALRPREYARDAGLTVAA